MCKIAIIPGIKPKHAKRAWRLAQALTKPMSKNDQDGFGYMGLGRDGLFVERWLNPSHAFKRRSSGDNSIARAHQGALVPDVQHSVHGIVDPQPTCLVLHARMATCGPGMANVHPFVSPDGSTALLHNGVISSPDRTKQLTSTCDSEVILTDYVSIGVAEDPTRIQGVSDGLSGYFALGILSRSISGHWNLDVVRDNQASLIAGYVPEIETLVYCTSESILREACKAAKMTVSEILQVSPNYLIRYDAVTGEPVQVHSFNRASPNRWSGPSLYEAYPSAIEDDDGTLDSIPVADRHLLYDRPDERDEIDTYEIDVRLEALLSKGAK